MRECEEDDVACVAAVTGAGAGDALRGCGGKGHRGNDRGEGRVRVE